MFLGGVIILVLIVLAAVHVFWALGGRTGLRSAIPEGENGQLLFQPRCPVTLAVTFFLLLAAAIVAAQSGMIAPHRLGQLPRLATSLLAALFALRAIGDFRYVGFFKRIRRTRFAYLDSMLYSPLCALLALALALTARN